MFILSNLASFYIIDEIDYTNVQTSYRQLESFLPGEQNRFPFKIKMTITGLTVIDDILYVTKHNSGSIDGYDSITYKFNSRYTVKGLFEYDPRDMTGIKRDCLYILNRKYDAYEIFIFDLNLKSIKRRWVTEDSSGSLSATREGNVIFTAHHNNKLMEYTPGGQLLREITLSSTITNPSHSLKLASGHLLVSYCTKNGTGTMDENEEVSRNRGVCIVNEFGEILKAFGEENESLLNELGHPACLAIDSSGSIMVADETSRRVLLLTSTLELKGELVPSSYGRKCRMMIHLDELYGTRLFMVDGDTDSEIRVFKYGKCTTPSVGLFQMILH